jgi:4-hydroxy-tetrahydrodipicolinate synthase
LSEVDLAMLAWSFKNVVAVKEATADLERMKRTRRLAPPGFKIVSGDDDKTSAMMQDPLIGACGVISVVSNIAPAAVQRMCEHWEAGEVDTANLYHEMLSPLFKVVTVVCPRKVQIPTVKPGEFRAETVSDKYRNPLAIKTMMAGLGMPAGPCRPPLGKMTLEGARIVREVLQSVWMAHPAVLEPIGKFYNVDVGARLADDEIWKSLARD